MNGNKDNRRFVNIISQKYLLVGVRGPENRLRSPIRNHRRRFRRHIEDNEHRSNSTRHHRAFRDYLIIGVYFRGADVAASRANESDAANFIFFFSTSMQREQDSADAHVMNQ